MNSIESIPQVWDDERDEQFFRITARLFDTQFCYGASVLLASYDLEDDFTSNQAPEPGLVANDTMQATDTTPAQQASR